MSLFDVDPYTVEPAPAEPVLSYGRRLTIRHRRDLAEGRHPITHRALATGDHPGAGHTCGDCASHVLQGGVAGRFHKCERNNTGGPATDLRVSWPACTLWHPELDEGDES